MEKEANQDKLSGIQQTLLPKSIIQQKSSSKEKSHNYQSINNNYMEDEQQDKSNQFSTPLSSNIQLNDSKSIRKYRYNILTTQKKWEIVKKSWATSVQKAASQFHVSPNNICRWRKGCERKRGAGRKIKDSQMQQKLFNWFYTQKLGTLNKKIIQKKARQFSKDPSFKASKGWYERFMKRNIQFTHYLKREDQEPSSDSKQIIGDRLANILRDFNIKLEYKEQQEQLDSLCKKENMMINENVQKMNSQHNINNKCKIQEQNLSQKSFLFPQFYSHCKQQYLYDVLNLDLGIFNDDLSKKKK